MTAVSERLVMFGPSRECGCPTELWEIDGWIEIEFHYEADGSIDAFGDASDGGEWSDTITGYAPDDGRAELLRRFRALVETEPE